MLFNTLLLAVSVCASAAAPLTPREPKCTFEDAEQGKACVIGCIPKIGPVAETCVYGSCIKEYVNPGVEGGGISPVPSSFLDI